MNYKLLLNFAMKIGEVMLKNGAETFRVEDSMSRILQKSGCDTAESFVTPTGIFATLDHSNIELMTMVKRIDKRDINLNKVALANKISREFCNDILSLEAAMKAIQSAELEASYPPALHILAVALSAGFFTLVLGGDTIDMLPSIVAGLFFGIMQWFLQKNNVSKFFIDIVGGSIIAFITYLFYYTFHIGNHFDLIVVSSVMPMVPGVAITNAIRDTLHGELISGVARGADALIVATCIAAGVGITLRLLLF